MVASLGRVKRADLRDPELHQVTLVTVVADIWPECIRWDGRVFLHYPLCRVIADVSGAEVETYREVAVYEIPHGESTSHVELLVR